MNRAKAKLENTRTELEAQKRQRSVLDSQEQVLRADVGVKRAALDLANTYLDYTRILAPEDGIVGERKVRAGQLVSPGTQVISLVQQREWVQANYKEDHYVTSARAIRLRFAWMLSLESSGRERLRRFRPPVGRNSPCCRQTTPPAISQR